MDSDGASGNGEEVTDRRERKNHQNRTGLMWRGESQYLWLRMSLSEMGTFRKESWFLEDY